MAALSRIRNPAGFLRAEFLIWLLLYLDLLMILPRTGGSIIAIDPQTMLRIGSIGLASLILSRYLLGPSGGLRNLFTPPLIWMTIFSLASFVSIGFSSMPTYSLWKAIEIAVALCAVAVIVARPEPWWITTRMYEVTVGLIALTALSALVGVILVPDQALVPERGLIPFRIAGVLPVLNSNSVGTFAAIGGLVCLIRFLQANGSRIVWGVLFTLLFGVLIFSTSRTAMAGFLVGLMVYAFFSRRRVLFYGIMAIALIVALFGYGQDIVIEWFRKDQADSTLSSLSGRVFGWQAAWRYFLESPIFGHGIASAARFDVLGDGPASTLHGSIFDVLVGVGLFGTIPWAIAIISVGLRLLRGTGKVGRGPYVTEWLAWRAELLAIFALLLVRAVTSSGLALHEKEQMLFLSLLAISMVRLPRVAAGAKEPPAGEIAAQRALAQRRLSEAGR